MVWLLSWFSVAKVTAYQRLYGIENLSSSLITSICQDSCGYIWIGTDYGLNRFDGVYFTQYHSDGVEGLKWDGVDCPIAMEIFGLRCTPACNYIRLKKTDFMM